MGLFVGSTPVTAVYVGSTPVKAVYVGAEKIWPTVKEVVQITLGTGLEARDQFRAALADRGLDYQTVTEIPFDIELVGSGSANSMFYGCSSLTSVPDMDTSQVTDMAWMFWECESLTHAPAMDTSQVTDMDGMFGHCSSLTYVPDMDTAQVTDMAWMFWECESLTDGNVRLLGKHPQVDTTDMITGSGLTREPWYTPDGTPIDVHKVTLTNVGGNYEEHPLVTVTVPAGETWSVRVQGTVTKANSEYAYRPYFRIGTTETGPYAQGSSVDMTGTVTSTNPKIIMITRFGADTSFTGTVTITRSI